MCGNEDHRSSLPDWDSPSPAIARLVSKVENRGNRDADKE